MRIMRETAERMAAEAMATALLSLGSEASKANSAVLTPYLRNGGRKGAANNDAKNKNKNKNRHAYRLPSMKWHEHLLATRTATKSGAVSKTKKRGILVAETLTHRGLLRGRGCMYRRQGFVFRVSIYIGLLRVR